MLNWFVLRLGENYSRTNGDWRGRYWVDGECGPFAKPSDAASIKARVGGEIIPFRESRLFKSVAPELLEAMKEDMPELFESKVQAQKPKTKKGLFSKGSS